MTSTNAEPSVYSKVTLENGTVGIVKFVGEIQGKPGYFFGVEVSRGKALNSGNVGTVTYFKCRPGKGVFVRRSKIAQHTSVQNLPITYGTRLRVPDRGVGVVKYIGVPDFGRSPDAVYYGLELDEPCGKNNGTVRDKFYFATESQRGLFVPAAKAATLELADAPADLEEDDFATTAPPAEANDTDTKVPEETSAVEDGSTETVTYLAESDDDEEIGPVSELTAQETELKALLEQLQQKCGAPVLSPLIREALGQDAEDRKETAEETDEDGQEPNEKPSPSASPDPDEDETDEESSEDEIDIDVNPTPVPVAPPPAIIPAPIPSGVVLIAPAPLPGGAPMPAPIPGGAPVPVPMPAPIPGGAPIPMAAPLPGGAPIPGQAPIPAPIPGGAPMAAPIPGGAPMAAPIPGGAPMAAPIPGGAPMPAPLPGAPAPLPGGAPAPDSAKSQAIYKKKLAKMAKKKKKAKKAKKIKKTKARRQARERNGGPWAAGTGYGCAFDNARWNMDEWDAEQTRLYNDLRGIVDNIANLMRTIPPAVNTRRLIRHSCLILFIADQLSTSSMAAMNKHLAFFVSLLTLLEAIAENRPELRTLLTKHIKLPGESVVNVWKILAQLYKQSTQAATLSSSKLDKGDEANQDIFPQVIATFEKMRDQFNNAGVEISVEERKETDDDRSYVEVMDDQRFDMVEAFSNHHFSGQSNGGAQRKLVRRLGNEFADLAVSLPINEESSIFLRVSESRMDTVKFLIIPADGTPYGGGCFVFDAYFPSNYPSSPPKVNLMTTGGGTVRFNPNLYENGYVCLSLLGTWSGESQGERWQPNISTFLQVVLSVQCLIFVPNPYYNEPGYEESYGDSYVQQEAERYSKDKQLNTVKWAMIDQLTNPTPCFKTAILRHFYLSRNRCMKNAKKWLGPTHALVVKLRGLLQQLDESVFTDDPHVPTVST